MSAAFGTAFTCEKDSHECFSAASAMPPLKITVDYGDGSGSAVWTRERPINPWSHVYTRPGTFNIYVVGG